MNALAKSAAAEKFDGDGSSSRAISNAWILVERLHRQLLDVIKDELDRKGEREVNSVQALLLFNIGDQEMTAGELRTRGHYLGSNVSYNLKKLVETGYIHHERSDVDRRSVHVRLTDKGAAIRADGGQTVRPPPRIHRSGGQRQRPANFEESERLPEAAGAVLARSGALPALTAVCPRCRGDRLLSSRDKGNSLASRLLPEPKLR